MNEVYKYTGMVVVWLLIATSSYHITKIIVEFVINELARKFKTMWVVFEFAYYRKEFLEWVKDKQRLSKTK